MRRSAELGSNATASSDKNAIAPADPSHRVASSKPGRILSARSSEPAGAECGGGAGTESGIADWQPQHTLAPGLHLVATPIGNLGDVTLRALWVLRQVDRILCEDTRVTRRLLARFGIDRPLETYHDHNADRVRPAVLDALRQGARLALVSDAGTPLIADPGYKLVRAAIAEQLPVTAAPGASAALTALLLSGLPTDVFLFAGFLPPRAAARRHRLADWAGLKATLIFYEGRSRLAAALTDMATVLGDRDAAVARELTKRHEEMRRGRLNELAAHYHAAGPPPGEMVVVIAPPEKAASPDGDEIDARLGALLGTASLRDAVARVAAETGLKRRQVYERALALTARNATK